jgi:hypothetical protein
MGPMTRVGGGFLSLFLGGCWYFGDCPNNVGGIEEGQQIETTIVERFAGFSGSSAPSCGELGDLEAGTNVTWQAHLAGSAETCDDDVNIHPKGLSSAELATTSSWTLPPTLTLPSGCRGEWQLRFDFRSPNPKLLGAVDSANPKWVLVRTFQAIDSAACADQGIARPSCMDAFVAESHPAG